MELLRPMFFKFSDRFLNLEQKFPQSSPIILQLLACLCFSYNSYQVKSLAQISPTYLIIYRSIMTLMVNGFVCMILKVDTYPTEHKDAYRRLVLRGVIGGISVQFWFTGIRILPLSEGIVIFRTTPVWTALLAVFLLKQEKFSTFLFFNVTVCMLGIILIAKPPWLMLFLGLEQQQSYPQQEWMLHLMGILFCITSAFLATINQILINSLSGQISQFAILQYFSFFSLMVAVFVECQDYKPFIIHDYSEFIGLINVGIFGCLGQWFMNRSFLTGKLTQISLVGQSQIIFNMMFDFLLLNSKFEKISIFGTLIVLSTLVLEIYRSKNMPNKKIIKNIRDSQREQSN